MSKPFTFIHAADLHLDTPFSGVAADAPDVARLLRDATLDAFDNLIQLCLDEQAAFLLLAGDIYDGPDHGIRAQLRFLAGMKKLDEAGIHAFIVTGNHDLAHSKWAALQGWPDNVHLFTAKPESVVVQQGGQPLARVHGISYPKKETSEDLAAKLKREGDEPFQLGLVHATVGAHAGHANYAPTTMDTLVRSGLDYWALGHVHTRDTLREADPVVAYPGNLQALSPRETGPRGALVVRVDEQGNTGLDFRPLDRVRFATERVDITDTDTLSAIATKLEEAAGRLRNEANASALVVRATLTGQSACFSKLSDPGKMDGLLETLRENQAQADPPLWWSRIVNEATPPLDLEQLKAQGGLEADLITLTETLLADPALLEKLADETWQPLYAKSGATKLTGERPSAQALAEELLEARDLALALLREEVS